MGFGQGVGRHGTSVSSLSKLDTGSVRFLVSYFCVWSGKEVTEFRSKYRNAPACNDCCSGIGDGLVTVTYQFWLSVSGVYHPQFRLFLCLGDVRT